jgi:hypothetical protein
LGALVDISSTPSDRAPAMRQRNYASDANTVKFCSEGR